MLDFCRKYHFNISFLALVFYLSTLAPNLLQKSLHILSHLGSHNHHHFADHSQSHQADHVHHFLNTIQIWKNTDADRPFAHAIKTVKAPKYAQILPDWISKEFNHQAVLDANFYLSIHYDSPILALTSPPPK